MVDRDGNIVYFNMQSVREETRLKQIPVVYLMFVYQVDSQTGDVINQWNHEVNREIPVTVLTEARTYGASE